VACPFRTLGCDHVGQLQTSSFHKKGCSFNPSNMPDFLKQDALKNSFNKEEGTLSADSEEDHLPVLAKPSLKMRLFTAGGRQRDLLCSMFQNDDGKSEVKSSGKGDIKSKSKSRKRKSTL
jgi:hypothetical protein